MYQRSVLLLPKPYQEDRLARESDVIVSTKITLYAEYKGFFIYVIIAIVFACWVGWALIPDHILRNTFSIHYYPDKYWLAALPAYFLLLLLFGYIFIALWNTEVLTLPLDDVRNFVDEYLTHPGETAASDAERVERTLDYVWKSPSGVWDLPVSLVNDVLYGEGGVQ